jgi:hypothetical protein
MKITITEAMKSNLLIFLDRVEYKGLKEVQALNELLTALSNPEPDKGVDKV